MAGRRDFDRSVAAFGALVMLLGCGSATLHGADGGAGSSGAAGSSLGGTVGGSGAGTGGSGGHSQGGGTAGGGGSAAGVGGSVSQGGASGAAQGAAGATGAGGTAGTGGSLGGTAGAGGAPTCTNITTDASNCGTCGHSCLGGTCVAGICQPLLLGTVPSTTDYARETVVSGGKVYVFTQVGVGNASNVWQTDANTPGTPTETMTGGEVGCVMNGELFWVASGTSGYTIDSCTLSNCTGTTTPIVMIPSGGFVQQVPGCDTVNNEIVWATQSSGSSSYTINRASPTGSNGRSTTSFFFPDDGTSWQLLFGSPYPGETDRIFYMDANSTTGQTTLYYIATDVTNAAGVSVATISGQLAGFPQSVLANDTIVLAGEYASSSVYETFSAPLPNGILSGVPPMFMDGSIFGGVIDQTTFYGSVSSATNVPSDAVVKCPLSNCSSPTIISRGQANANYFADDATAIYWTTSAQTSTQGFSIWKAAK